MPRDQTDLLKLIYMFEHEEDLWKVSAEIYNNKRNAALHRITEGLNGEFDGTNWIYSNEVRIWILVLSYLYTIYSYIYIISLQNNMLTYYWINLFWTAHLKMSKNVLCQQVSYAWIFVILSFSIERKMEEYEVVLPVRNWRTLYCQRKVVLGPMIFSRANGHTLKHLTLSWERKLCPENILVIS